ncbi:MAG: hypothetical protein RKE49_11655 [Oceanicaulis sp.]
MVPVRGYAKKRVAVLGLSGPGFAAAHALAAGGADVTVWDSDAPQRFKAHASGLNVEDLTERDWGDLAALVVEDAGLVTAEDPPRLIDLARAVGAPVIAARCLLVEAAARAPGIDLALLAGRHAEAAAQTALHLLDAAGLPATGLLDERPATASSWVIAALSPAELALLPDTVEAKAFVALSPGPDPEASVLERLADGAVKALITSAETRACARLIANRRGPHVAAVSGRQVLGGGVYSVDGMVYDALDGRARRAGALSPCAPREAIAAGYALARRLGVAHENAAQALAGFKGARGHGRTVLEVGPVSFVDWSAAHTPASAVDAVSGRAPVVWVAGPGLDRHAAGLLAEAGGGVRAVHLVTDRGRAAKPISGVAACLVHRELSGAIARGLHDALRSGAKGCALVYAPGSLSGHTGETFEEVARALLERALRGDAA